MANNSVNVLINATVKGTDQVKGLNSELDKTGAQANKVAPAFKTLGATFTAVGLAAAGLAIAGKQVYSFVKEGAAVDRTRDRFDRLAATLNTTGAELRHGLRDATSGMTSDLELMAGASQMVSLGLASTADETIRLTRLTGELGWNMQQLVLTLANMSTMRLDALGLSVAAVTGRAKELEIQGMAAADAFRVAVIEAGEAKIAIEGSIADSTAGALAKGEAAWANFWTMMKSGAAGFAEGIGLIGLIEGHSEASTALADLKDRLDGLVAAGKLTEEQARLIAQAWQFSTETHALAADTVERLTSELDKERAATISAAEAADLLVLAVASADQVMLGAAARQDFMAASALRAAENMYIAARAAYALATAYGATSTASQTFHTLGERAANRNRAVLEATGKTVYELGGYFEKATGSVGGFASALDSAASKQREFADAFNAEIATEFGDNNDALKERQKIIEQGLIGADGLANMTAINATLYEQAQAAGATAGQLAMLGIATGQFSEEQARAALKAALLMEKIKQMSAAVVAGDISYGDAVAGITDFAVELDTSAAESSIDDLAGAVDGYASGNYEATVGADTDAAGSALDGIINKMKWINSNPATASVNVSTNEPNVTGTHACPPFYHWNGTTCVPDGPGNALGGGVGGGSPILVGERGPELFIPSADGQIIPHGKSVGGGGYTINVTNYIDGKMDRSGIETVTVDSMKGALRGFGLGVN